MEPVAGRTRESRPGHGEGDHHAPRPGLCRPRPHSHNGRSDHGGMHDRRDRDGPSPSGRLGRYRRSLAAKSHVAFASSLHYTLRRVELNEQLPVIEAFALTKRYGGVTAVDELDLRIHAGEVFCLLGPNGAGKTTTVSMFLGFVAPSYGSARVCGLDVGTDDPEIKRRLAYIPEQVSLYPYLSGLENLRFFLALSNSRHISRAGLVAVLREAGLPESAIDRPVSTYSKGMRQKVGIALALAKHARALFLDEPTSGLDPAAAAEFSALLERLRDRGAGILMVTHDLFRAREVATQLGIMEHGHLVELLDPKTVAPDEIERRYLAAVNHRARSREESP